MSYFECPKCKSKNVSTERRPNGISICQECKHSALTKDFIQTIEVKAHYEAIERITSACNYQISELTKANSKLVEALKFYADKENWSRATGNKVANILNKDDFAMLNCGGGRARIVLKELEIK